MPREATRGRRGSAPERNTGVRMDVLNNEADIMTDTNDSLSKSTGFFFFLFYEMEI